MDEDAWIEGRLSDALKAAASDAHAFPEPLTVELSNLLSNALQQPKKPAELDEIAASLIAANRGAT